MDSIYLFLIVALSLFCCLNCSSSQVTREFDEKKFLGKHYTPDHNTRSSNQFFRKDNHEHSLATDSATYINFHGHRENLPQRRTSISPTSWHQQNPIAAPIRSHEPSTESISDLVTLQPLSSNYRPLIDNLSENLSQFNWSNFNSNGIQVDLRHIKDTTDENFVGDIKTRTDRPPLEVEVGIGTESKRPSTVATRINQDSNVATRSFHDVPGLHMQANINNWSLNNQSNDIQPQQYSIFSQIHSQYNNNNNNNVTRSNNKLDHSIKSFTNYTHNNKDQPSRSPLSSSSKLNESMNTNNALNNQQNYQQSTIKLTSIKTFEGLTEMPPSIVSSEYVEISTIGRHSINWWAIGTPNGLNLASKLTKDNYADFCQTTSLLSTNKQRSLCEIHPKIMQIIAKGLKTAIDECQYQFNSSRWNCSVIDDGVEVRSTTLKKQKLNQRFSMEANNTIRPIFGSVMVQQNRERSFLSAIMSAGIAYSITKACSRGDLPDECGCDQRLKNKNNHGKWEWGGCSEDIDYGIKFSKDFTDSTEYKLDAASMINVHNYEVGRRVLKSNVDLTCKCHGVSGSCVMRTCWKRLGSFRDIGEEIIARYERATHVQLSNQSRSSRSKLRPVKRGARKPNKKDLVFIDESPDYCTEDRRLGILGTKNRECNSTSDGLDGCKLLCCGRGYQNIIEDREEDCECKFVWCCEVKCQKCKKRREYDSCN